MKGSDYLILLSTFLIGMLAGGYLYVTVFAPVQAEKETERSERDWEIYGKERGDCQMVGECAELFVASDRTYRYSEDGSSMEVGNVPLSLRSRLTTGVRQTEPVNMMTCQSASGRYVVYDIEAYGERYEVATCSGSFIQTDLAASLDAVWDYVTTGTAEGGTPVILEEGLSAWLEEQLDKKFQYDD